MCRWPLKVKEIEEGLKTGNDIKMRAHLANGTRTLKEAGSTGEKEDIQKCKWLAIHCLEFECEHLKWRLDKWIEERYLDSNIEALPINERDTAVRERKVSRKCGRKKFRKEIKQETSSWAELKNRKEDIRNRPTDIKYQIINLNSRKLFPKKKLQG